jgi:hypothetical protein
LSGVAVFSVAKLTLEDFVGAFTAPQAEQELGVCFLTLIRWRKANKGPPCVRVGARWFYPRKQLLAFKAAREAKQQKTARFQARLQAALDSQQVA